LDELFHFNHRRQCFGQPVLVGGSMGTESWVLAGLAKRVARLKPVICIKG